MHNLQFWHLKADIHGSLYVKGVQLAYTAKKFFSPECGIRSVPRLLCLRLFRHQSALKEVTYIAIVLHKPHIVDLSRIRRKSVPDKLLCFTSNDLAYHRNKVNS